MRLAALAIAVGIVGCAPGAARTGRVGSTIVLLSDGRLAVLNPDQGSVSFVDAQSLVVQATVDVGDEPTSMLQVASGRLLIATHRGGEVVAVDPATASVVGRRPVCTGPFGLAEAPDKSWIGVTCEWGGSVQRLDPTLVDRTEIATGLRRPRGIVIAGETTIVTEFVGGHVVALHEGRRDQVSLVPSAAPYRPALTRMTANLAGAILPAFDHLFVTHELVNHTGEGDEAVADDYGTVMNGTPKINAAVSRLRLEGESVSIPPETPPVYSRFDKSEHAFSGATALAASGDRYLLVAHLATNDVAVLDTTATDPAKRLVATYAVGNGPSGIAVDDKAGVAYVDNAFDGSISKIDLKQSRDASAPRHPPMLTLIRGLPSPYSVEAQAGRKLFNDATNGHVTPSRVVACASCHPGGGEDGLVWFMQTENIPLKRRRTPHLANAHSATAPFHWDAQFPTMSDLVRHTVTDLMAGDGLLVESETVQAYIDEMVKPPLAPPQDGNSVERGRILFQGRAGCVTCHIGELQTDRLRHAVLSPESMSSDDAFAFADTPALRGLFFRAPFFHDGRSSDLHDLLTRSDARGHGQVDGLTNAEVDDLVTYLKTL